MKRLFIIAALGLFLASCGTTAEKSGFYEHDTLHKNMEHTIFSICGHKNPTNESFEKSQSQDWWGIPVEENAE